nr:PREDICTED: kinesin-like protein KIF11-B [Bemisia tabaci]
MSKSRGANQSEKPIQVFVRVRPLNQSEKNSKSYSVVNVNNGREVSVKEKPIERTARNFIFDKAFGPDSKQVDVYKRVVYPLIEEVLAGYNCTVFAYGQTGTGKTFTMEGEKSNDINVSWEDDPLTGIIPRSLSHLFDELRIKQLEHSVRVSFLELYNEEIFDLLSPIEDSKGLRLFEDSSKKGSVIIQNLEEVPVSNKAQLYKVMEKGSQKRQTAATLMNAHSSRSHTIFSITVHIKETSDKGEELFKIGKLNLVDLAGSENIGRSGAVDKRAREAGNINQSLLTLGRVITSLVEKAPHIPYRESKLTRLLQDSLGGRTKTSIIATVSPALCNLEETLSTLEYAARAKNITNRPEVNQKLTKKAFLKEYEVEVERLKRDLQAARDRNGIFVDPENYTKMTLQIEEQEKEISENLSNIKALKAEMEKRQEIIEELSTSNKETKEELERRKQTCRETRKALREVTVDRNENKHLKERHMETEKKLRKQAEKLLAVANVATSDAMKLLEKIERKDYVETTNSAATNHLYSSLQNQFDVAASISERQSRSEAEIFSMLNNFLANTSKVQADYLDRLRDHLGMICDVLSERMRKYADLCQDWRKEKHTKLMADLSVLKEKIDSNNVTLNETIFDGIIPKLQDVFDHLNDFDKFLVKFNKTSDKAKKDITMLSRETKKLAKSFKEMFETHLTKLKSIESEEEDWDNLEAKLREAQDARVEGRKKMVLSMQEALLEFSEKDDERHEEILRMLTLFSTASKKARLAQRELSSAITEDIKACEPNFAEVMSVLNKVEDNLKHQQDSTVEKLQSWKNSESERLTAIIGSVENLSSVSKESQKSFDSWSAGFNEGLVESDTKEEQREKEQEEGILEEVSNQVSQSKTVLNDYAESHLTSISEMGNIMQDHLANAEKLRKELEENMQAQNNVLEKFVQEDFKKDVPTGSTPQKREFDYPQDLTATSPHEIILARFRETVNHELSFNDSLAESIHSEASQEMGASTSAETTSLVTSVSDSSLNLDQKENTATDTGDTDVVTLPQSKRINQSSIPQMTPRKKVLGEMN